MILAGEVGMRSRRGAQQRVALCTTRTQVESYNALKRAGRRCPSPARDYFGGAHDPQRR